MVPETDSMDFKVGELLKEIRLDPSTTKTIKQDVYSIMDAINMIPDQEVGFESAVGFIRDLCVPFDKVSFTFKSPKAIKIGGSHSIRCVAKLDTIVDLLIRMPNECFHQKNFLNQRYHAKKCLYLCVVENNLKSYPLTRKIEWLTFLNEARKPIFIFTEHAGLSKFFIRIIPTATSLFDASRLNMSLNNVRAFNQGDTSLATPRYNSSILEDMFLEGSTDFVKQAFHEWKTLGDALLLLKGLGVHPNVIVFNTLIKEFLDAEDMGGVHE